jgi:hypothetical protein
MIANELLLETTSFLDTLSSASSYQPKKTRIYDQFILAKQDKKKPSKSWLMLLAKEFETMSNTSMMVTLGEATLPSYAPNWTSAINFCNNPSRLGSVVGEGLANAAIGIVVGLAFGATVGTAGLGAIICGTMCALFGMMVGYMRPLKKSQQLNTPIENTKTP